MFLVEVVVAAISGLDGGHDGFLPRPDRPLALLSGFGSESGVVPLDVDGAPPVLGGDQDGAGARGAKNVIKLVFVSIQGSLIEGEVRLTS